MGWEKIPSGFVEIRPGVYERIPSGHKKHKCKTCGIDFVGVANRIYCCLQCSYNDKERLEGNNKKQRGTSVCKKCGKEFEIKTNAPRGIFCSRSCSGAYTSKKILSKYKPKHKPTKKLICKTCNNEFSVAPHLEHSRTYCSRSCSTIGSTKKRTATIRSRFKHYGGYSRCKHGWHSIGGQLIFARSMWESNYAYYLEWLKQNGKIKSWMHEPVTFWFEGIKRGVCSYLPDYEVIENDGNVIYHEVKGWMDKKSVTKLKRMKKYHPNVKLFLADAKWFKENAPKLEKIVSGWGSEPSKKRPI